MSRNTNTDGSTNLTSGSMLAFDRLPKALRQALANSDHNWSGEQLNRARRNKRVRALNPCLQSIAGTVAFIREQDASKHNADAAAGLVCGGQR